MKKLKLFGFLFLSIMIAACSSDDDSSNTNNGDGDGDGNGNGNNDDNPIEVVENHFTYGESEIDIVDGMVEYYGDWTGTGSHNFDITLVNTELSGPENDYMPVENVFSAIYFELFSENSTDIAVGTYEFAETAAAGTYAAAFVALDIDINNPNEENLEQITEGTLTVIQNGANYEFEFTGLTIEGTEVSLYFDGSLHTIDFPSTGKMTSGKAPVKNIFPFQKK